MSSLGAAAGVAFAGVSESADEGDDGEAAGGNLGAGAGGGLGGRGVGASSSSAAAAAAAPLADATMERDLFVAVTARRAYRLKQCRSVPASVLLYAFFIGLLVAHARIGAAYEVEQSLFELLVQGTGSVGFAVASAADWYTWLADTLSTTILYSAANADQRGYVARYNLMVGGVRLVTARSVPSPCGLNSQFARRSSRQAGPPSLAASPPRAARACGHSSLPRSRLARARLAGALAELYGLPCYLKSSSLSSYSKASYGNNTGIPPNQWALIASAFVSNETEAGVPEFVLYIDTRTGPGGNLGSTTLVANLQTAGWLDAATRSADFQLALLNGQSGVFASVVLRATFTSGSLVETTSEIRSVPVDPYSPASDYWLLYVADALLVVYWAYLAWGAGRRVWAVVRAPGGACAKLGMLCSYWRLLDLATVAAMASVIILWALLCAELAALRSDIARVVATNPDAIQSGPSTVQAELFDVVERLGQVKQAAVCTLIFLTLRLFKYFAFQPRLAIMSTVFARSCGDIVTHGFVFALLLVMFGVWAHFLFGPQAVDWATPASSVFSIFRFSMYDYKFLPMQQQYPFLAGVFYVAFMILITNLVLWMFLAIVFETYTEVRYESHNTPSAFEEGAAFFATVPRDARACWARRCGSCGASCRARCCNSSRSALPPRRGPLTIVDITATISWDDILRAVHKDDELSRASMVTPQALARALGISRDAANLLISDTEAVADFILGLPVPDGIDDTAGIFSRESATQLAAQEAEAQMSARARALYGTSDSLGAPGLATGRAPATAPLASAPSRAFSTRVPIMVGGVGRMLSRAASVRFREAAAIASTLHDAQAAIADSAAQNATLEALSASVDELRAQLAAIAAAVNAKR